MFAFVFCFFALLATAGLAEPAERETAETGPRTVAGPLCDSVRAASKAPTPEEADALLRGEELPAELNFDSQFPTHEETLSPAERARFLEDRRLFESSLINWRFFEDLAPKQRSMVGGVIARCGETAAAPSLAEAVFEQWNASQRATFVSVTHGLKNSRLVDSRNGKDLGDALGLIQELIDIQGENNTLSSDQQFQLIVRLVPEAREKLEHAAYFQQGENHVFHKGYPVSFRQFRRIGLHGKEAGLHFCLTQDGRSAQIHIDYRFGFLHLVPTNSDVRAEGNHQRHADRWPEFGLAVRPIRVRRIVLH